MRFSETLGISHDLKLAENEVRQRLDAILKPLSITASQYSALSALEESAGLSNAELARRCFVTAQTMIRLTQSLEAAGLIKEESRGGDVRRRAFVLTSKAVKAVCQAHVAVNQVEKSMVKGLTKREVELSQKFLRNVLANLRGG